MNADDMEPEKIHNAAHSTTSRTTELLVSGMTCGNCARHVTEAIQGVPGVHSATVSLDSRRASVRWSAETEQNPSALISAIEEEGYGAKIVEADSAETHGEHQLAGWQINLWIGILGTAPLMIGEWIFGLGMEPAFQWASFVVAAIVQVFAGAPFYRGAWNQLKIGSSNMDTLVALGSTTAFGYSAWAILSGHDGHLYFMESAAIITLISVGHWMESRVSVRASGALRKLLNLAPQTAKRISHAESVNSLSRPSDTLSHPTGEGRGEGTSKLFGNETEVPVCELKIGDLVALHPGDRVPTDGEVEAGDSAVDEAMLTGESVPVDKSARSRLYAGTVNLNGRLVMRVTATGEETALAHIIAAVQRAQTSRANIQRLGDRVSSVFVPIIVAIAIGAGLWWGFSPDSAARVHDWLAGFLWHAHPPVGTLAAAFIIAAAVLIIACPCAMGLATPAAIMAGSNAAAQRGILIRDGVALEKAGEVTAVIFDKTGTLTLGKPQVAKTWETPDHADSAQILAAALAKNSNHPISQAVAKLSPAETLFSDWREMRGAGVQAKLAAENGESKLARLGSLNWLRESGVDLRAGENFVAEWSSHGATIVGLSVEKNLRALFAIKDTVKSGAANVVAQLNRRGFKTYLLTGDNALTAASIAKQTGIPAENVFAEVRPEQKAEFVKKLQSQRERVAFVGDGINDAPALEQADLGIAVSRASDVAREAADIILLNSEIEAVPESLGLARATLRTIKQNLFWAFFYNAIGVPLAALGFMSPVLCAAAMGFSDLIVIGNALRLRRWKLR
ncbi:MAG TPA: cation-translocating P-type ATPase [Verrucomicrobiae bacterium]|nr:cation-translocating P-type ATPase [Verrucomicrobiae bacterium]